MISQDAAVKRLELILGYISKEDVISWADDIISKVKDPPFHIYDISLTQTKTSKEVASMLQELGEGSDIAEVSIIAFRHCAIKLFKDLEFGSISSDEVATALYEIGWKSDLVLPEEYADFTNWIDDEFALVRQGIKERRPAETVLSSHPET